MAKIGYARVSSDDQSTEIQREKLKAQGCVRVFAENKSGARADNREELQACLAFLEPGDTLVVVALDRLGRSLLDILNIIADIKKRGCHIHALREGVDTTTPFGEAMFQMSGVFAQLERSLIADRRNAGIAKAKERGAYRGRKRKVTKAAVDALKAKGLGMAAIARELGCSRSNVYRATA